MKASELFTQMYKPRPNALKVISLGWGVQSFTLAAMVALGELEPVNFAIHADTTHESSWVYKFANDQTPWLESFGVNIVTVKPDEVYSQVIDQYGGVLIPSFSFRNNRPSMLSRQCTGKWKIIPIRKHLKSIRVGKPIEMWIGITTDEIQRVKVSNVKYISHRWPLIEKNMSRTDCINWLTANDLPIPRRSSCNFCPYHSFEDWRHVMASNPDRDEVINLDQSIRNLRPPDPLFLHQSRVPIADLDMRTLEEQGQLSLWNNECDGMCGL